jgi:hypothetical protein
MYAAKRLRCGSGADKRVPTKQFYTKMLIYNTVVLAKTIANKTGPSAEEEDLVST